MKYFCFAFLILITGSGLDDQGEEVLIPAGKVVIGNHPAGYGNRPPQIVMLPDYFIEKTEVTNKEFARFVDDSGYVKKQFWIIPGIADSLQGWNWLVENEITHPKYWYLDRMPFWKGAKYSSRDDSPVVGVSWFEAHAYAKWAGKRLPTAEEWEKAARGTSRKYGEWQGVGVGAKYPWGNNFFQKQRPPQYQLCNWRLRYYAYRYPDTNGRARSTGYARETWKTDGFREQAAPVKHFSPQGDSPYGVADLAGNVWEWTATGFPKYEDAMFIIKGGGWYRSTLDHLKTGYIHGAGPYYRGRSLGFRCARSQITN